MKISIGAGIAALVAGAALAATPVLAQSHGGGGHSGGGGFHAGGGGFHAGGGFRGAAGSGGALHSGGGGWRGGWHGGGWRGGNRFFFGGGFWPAWGFYDPYYWDGGYVGAYAIDPYDDGYSDAPYGAGYPAAGGPSGAPPGYDCDGWRWDANAGRYVAAKVSCQ